LIAKANDLSHAYLDNRKINFDEIYERIVKVFIKLDDFSSAHAINDKILAKSLNTKGNRDIEKRQSEISSKDAERAIKAYDDSVLKEREWDIKKRARDAQQERQNDFRRRTGLRRQLYDKGLSLLKSQDFKDSLKEYNAQIKFLLGRKSLNLVGISLAVSLLIFYKLQCIEDFEKSLNDIKNSLGSLKKSFSETYPITLLEYIIEIEKLGDVIKFKEALQYIEYLALFNEELDLLYELLDKSRKTLDRGKGEKIKNNYRIRKADFQREKRHC